MMKNMLNKVKMHIKTYYKDIIINLVIISLIFLAFTYNFPYLVYKPGGTISLESRMYIDGQKVTLGDYNLAYVSVSRGNLPNLLLAKVIKDWDIVKEEKMLIPHTDYETTFKREKLDMQNSINTAKYIAYQKAGKASEMNIKSIYIYAIDEKADTDLKVLDEIIKVDGQEFTLKEINEYINSKEIGNVISFEVKNGNKTYQRYGKVTNYDGQKLIGIYIKSAYDVITDPEIKINAKKSEAGSSGGLMMTLAIYDALSDKDMTSGKKIVGTGTIEIDGTIGGIGGVKYKLLGANKAKADIFIIPYENYEEAKKVYDDYNLQFALIPVKSFDDVIDYLDSI